jgi:hypothetical protein
MKKPKFPTQKEIDDLNNAMSYENRMGDFRRARSFTVGTCFGGTTELMMRGNDGNVLWTPMQPVEVIELIHQLAANVGCHINLQPRKDFSSWRDWKYTEEELAHYRGVQSMPGVGWAPHEHDINPHQNRGQVLPPPEQQPGLKIPRSKENVVATKKTVNKRSAKRATKAP